MPSTTHRQVSLSYGRPGDRVSFADGYPLLLTSEASLAELNRRMDTDDAHGSVSPEPGGRWERAVRGRRLGAHPGRGHRVPGREALRTLRRDDHRPANRCARGKEPLRTLATFRDADGKVLFGENLIHDGPRSGEAGDRSRYWKGGTPGS